MLKRILIPILILILTGCGYTPLYNSSEKVNYNVNFVEEKGDNKINDRIISEITKLTRGDTKRIYNISFTSDYSKSIISKDAKGSATNYELIVDVIFHIEYGTTKRTINMNEKQNIKKIEDIFDQRNYENTLKNNFATSIANKLNIELLSIK